MAKGIAALRNLSVLKMHVIGVNNGYFEQCVVIIWLLINCVTSKSLYTNRDHCLTERKSYFNLNIIEVKLTALIK